MAEAASASPPRELSPVHRLGVSEHADMGISSPPSAGIVYVVDRALELEVSGNSVAGVCVYVCVYVYVCVRACMCVFKA